MGQIIYIEQVKIEQDQKIRSYALRHFPWEEMDLIQQYMINPLIENWSKQRQIIITEASFRLVFEAYIFGIRGQKKRKDSNKCSNHPVYDHLYDRKIDQLVDRVMEDFLIYRLFPHQTKESMHILFRSLAEEWFLRGLMSVYGHE